MSINVKTRQRIVTAVAVVAGFLLGGIAFVTYFMDAVYEAEDTRHTDSIPPAVLEQFAKRFPGASAVAWEFDEGHYEAVFHWRGNQDMECVYEPDGTWLKTEMTASYADLPAKARNYLETREGYEVADIRQVQEPGSSLAFEVEIGNRLMEFDCHFDAEGNLLDRERDGPVLE